MRIRSSFTATVTLGAVAVLTAGCLGDSGGGGGNDNTSNTIEIMYAFSTDQESGFKDEVNAWADENNVEVKFTQSSDFNSLINTRVQGNDAPDVALFPQPGIMKDFASQGLLADLSDVVDQGDLDNLIQGALETGQVDGTQYAIPMSINVKSIVFYPKQAAEAAGLTEPPATFDDLVTLTDTIAATGTTPWCFGIESGAATGWPATDWVENLMLINNGSDVYNQWVAHEIPFNDPKVAETLDQIDQLLLADGHTNGGRAAISGNNFNTAANPMFDDPPGCYMYRQGNFVAKEGGFPDAVLADLDNVVGVFPMPGKTADDHPVLGGGDLAGIFSQDNESAKKLVQFLASSDYGSNGYAETGAWISPRTDFDVSQYPSELLGSIASIAYESTEFVFDGSDQMPGEVGSGSFWSEMTAFINGDEDAKTALDNIESSWPA
jgi:alpha-glucoside transport system substrate-binding protein